MAIWDDTGTTSSGKIEILRPTGRRTITHAVHDIDGTHSLIRDWPPVMSLIIHYAMMSGLPEDFDSEENVKKLIERSGKENLPETDHFCVESAGLSALTQMEFGIRRAIEIGKLMALADLKLKPKDLAGNALITKRIWKGEERFDDIKEPDLLKSFLAVKTPRLFKLYETVLNGVCRDRNTAAARQDPVKWRVPGSFDFMKRLHSLGVINFFVTGAVIYPEGGMYEEVMALGYEVGAGKMVESLEGSSWDKKMPKQEVMKALFRRLGIDPVNALIVGDGRTEIQAGAEMGCVTLGRLPRRALRMREIHKKLGVNYIVEDYTEPALYGMIR
jgi:phosphoglycolate phosphatase-like HAD superfamily hydrolase